MQCSRMTVQEWRHQDTISMQPLASMLEENTTRTILSVDLVLPTMWVVMDHSGTLWFTSCTYMLTLFSRSELSAYKCTRKIEISLVATCFSPGLSHFSLDLVLVHFARLGGTGDSKLTGKMIPTVSINDFPVLDNIAVIVLSMWQYYANFYQAMIILHLVHFSNSVTWGSLVSTGLRTSSLLLYHPRLYPSLYRRFDKQFRETCCGVANLCGLYLERRPPNNCSGYNPPAWCKFWNCSSGI